MIKRHVVVQGSKVWIRGAFSNALGSTATIQLDGWSNTITLNTITDDTRGASLRILVGAGLSQFTVSDLTLNGAADVIRQRFGCENHICEESAGVIFSDTDDTSIMNVNVVNVNGDGVYFHGAATISRNVQASDVTVNGSLRVGINSDGVDWGLLSNNVLHNTSDFAFKTENAGSLLGHMVWSGNVLDTGLAFGTDDPTSTSGSMVIVRNQMLGGGSLFGHANGVVFGENETSGGITQMSISRWVKDILVRGNGFHDLPDLSAGFVDMPHAIGWGGDNSGPYPVENIMVASNHFRDVAQGIFGGSSAGTPLGLSIVNNVIYRSSTAPSLSAYALHGVIVNAGHDVLIADNQINGFQVGVTTSIASSCAGCGTANTAGVNVLDNIINGPLAGTPQAYGIYLFNDPGTTSARSASPLDLIVSGNQVNGLSPSCFGALVSNTGSVAPLQTHQGAGAPSNGVEMLANAGVSGIATGGDTAATCGGPPAISRMGMHASRTSTGKLTIQGTTQKSGTVALNEPDAQYVVSVMPSAMANSPNQQSTRVRTITKTATGFTMNVERGPGSSTASVTFDWMVMR